VLWLGVRLEGGVPTGGIAHGVRHHRPVDVAVPAALVRQLLRSGVPAVTIG
jgi:hypothetical protein